MCMLSFIVRQCYFTDILYLIKKTTTISRPTIYVLILWVKFPFFSYQQSGRVREADASDEEETGSQSWCWRDDGSAAYSERSGDLRVYMLCCRKSLHNWNSANSDYLMYLHGCIWSQSPRSAHLACMLNICTIQYPTQSSKHLQLPLKYPASFSVNCYTFAWCDCCKLSK